jgi:hypothetical protein
MLKGLENPITEAPDDETATKRSIGLPPSNWGINP